MSNRRQPTNLTNVDFWAARIAAIIKLAEHNGMTVEITEDELVVSRQVSDVFIARTEVRWRARQPKEADGDRVVAYRLGGNRGLCCARCAPSPRGDIWEPVTSDDLPDGGVCTACGVDVLIPQQPKKGRP